MTFSDHFDKIWIHSVGNHCNISVCDGISNGGCQYKTNDQSDEENRNEPNEPPYNANEQDDEQYRLEPSGSPFCF